MGFLDTLIQVGFTVAGGFLGGPAGAAAGAALGGQLIAPSAGTGTATRPVFPTTIPAIDPGAIGAVSGFPTGSTADRQANQLRDAAIAQQILQLPALQQQAAVQQVQAAQRSGQLQLVGLTGTAARGTGIAGTGLLSDPAVAARLAQATAQITRGVPMLRPVGAAIAEPRGGVGVFRRTMIQTIDRATGQLVSFKFVDGAPFLMNKDIVAAKRVFRLSTKLHNRLPRRSVKRRQVDCPSSFANFVHNRAVQHALLPPTGS